MAWFTFNVNESGSMRAMTWPFLTWELKSTRISLIWPETWEPTCTETTGLSVPVTETTAVMAPRSTFWRRNSATALRAPYHP